MKITKRIVYGNRGGNVIGYVVSDGTSEYQMEYTKLMAAMKSGKIQIDNAIIVQTSKNSPLSSGLEILKGRGCALSKLPKVVVTY